LIFLTTPLAHDKAIKKVMSFCLNTKNQALLIKSQGNWGVDWNEDNLFEITGVSHSNYANSMQTRKSVIGYATFLNRSLVMDYTTNIPNVFVRDYFLGA
jgi:hypothetical protein